MLCAKCFALFVLVRDGRVVRINHPRQLRDDGFIARELVL